MTASDISERLMEFAARTMDDEQFARMFSPDGLARTASWQTEDDWIVQYTTSRIRGGSLGGIFATMVYKPKGRGRQRIWERVRLDRCDTRREAKQRAERYYYEHSPKAAERHGWSGGSRTE